MQQAGANLAHLLTICEVHEQEHCRFDEPRCIERPRIDGVYVEQGKESGDGLLRVSVITAVEESLALIAEARRWGRKDIGEWGPAGNDLRAGGFLGQLLAARRGRADGEARKIGF